jgi:hypothetical protein
MPPAAAALPGDVCILSVTVCVDKAQFVCRVEPGLLRTSTRRLTARALADPNSYVIHNESSHVLFYAQMLSGNKRGVVESLFPGERRSFGFDECVDAATARTIEFTDSDKGAKCLVRPGALNAPVVALGRALVVRARMAGVGWCTPPRAARRRPGV